MNKNFLPGIKSVEYISANMLMPDVQDFIIPSEKLKVLGTFTAIPIVDIGSITIKSDFEKNTPIYKVSAKFDICAEESAAKQLIDKLTSGNYCYRLTLIDGRKILLGTDEKPHPVVNNSYVNDDKPAGSRGFGIEISYTNTYSYIELL